MVKVIAKIDKVEKVRYANTWRVKQEEVELTGFVTSSVVLLLREPCTTVQPENIVEIYHGGNLNTIIEAAIEKGAKEIRIGDVVIRLKEKEQK
ncbi:MAG: hypothetical protein DRJ03_22150 [Chloroflexi bacterium]|nr:MAG: hypothetical protein DRJ03_22150 [Chloroflexota bacterium]